MIYTLSCAEPFDQVDRGEGVLFLSDIPGGSPFQQSTAVAVNLQLADVLSGTNLVMVAEACMERGIQGFPFAGERKLSAEARTILKASILKP